MIEWLNGQPGDRVFLEAGGESHTFGEIVRRVEKSRSSGFELIRPRLDVDSVVHVLGAMSWGCAVLLSPERGTPSIPAWGNAVCVIFTSGTTGAPKGARLTQANWEAAARASMAHLDHSPDDTWLLAMPLHHVAGLGILLRSSYVGGRVRIASGFEPASFARDLHSDVTIASVVPTMLQRLLDFDTGPYTGLKAVLVGGGPIPDGLLERAAEAGIPALPTYGMTETCGQVATLRPGAPPEAKAHLLPGVEIDIDPTGRVSVRGPMVSPGYLGQPDRDPRDWFNTGDLGVLDEEGALRILGRADELIISGGENIDPMEVGGVVGSHPRVGNVLVVGIPSAEWGQEVGCLYTGEVDPIELERWAGERLPRIAIPRRWKQVAEIPQNDLGKPDLSVGRAILTPEPG